MSDIQFFEMSETALGGRSILNHPEERRGRRLLQSEGARDVATFLLQKLGSKTHTIGKGESGEPIWPDDFVGSISHTTLSSSSSAVTAVVGKARDGTKRRFLGVDVEPLASSPRIEKLASKIFNAQERDLIASSQLQEGLLIGFSAKETIYKALFPLYRKSFYFDSARIVQIDSDRLTIEIKDPVASALNLTTPLEISWEEVTSKNIPSYISTLLSGEIT